MSNPFEFEDSQDISQMNAEEKVDHLKAMISGRDLKNGRFLKGHSGNIKGRPRTRTTLSGCLNKSFSRKATAKIDGKTIITTNLQLACDMVVQSSLASGDLKTIMKLLKDFSSTINLSDELPPPKVKPLKKDPSVEMIKKAIFNSLDEECGIKYNDGDENNLIE